MRRALRRPARGAFHPPAGASSRSAAASPRRQRGPHRARGAGVSATMAFGSKSRAQPLGVLRRLMERAPVKGTGEVCEMCAQPIAEPHSHVVNTETRSLLCTCRYCYLLFTRDGAAKGKYRAVPERDPYDPDFALSESQWERLQIPVRIAFFFLNSTLGRVVTFYPSPAGATESTLELGDWQGLVAENRVLQDMLPDVEALLVYG